MKTSEGTRSGQRYYRTTCTNDALRAQLKAYLETNILGGKSMAEAYAGETLPPDTDFETMAHILEVLSGSLRGSAEAQRLMEKGKPAQALEAAKVIEKRLRSDIEYYRKDKDENE